MCLHEEIVPIVYPQCGFHTSVRALLKPGRSNARFTQIYTKLIYILKWAKKFHKKNASTNIFAVMLWQVSRFRKLKRSHFAKSSKKTRKCNFQHKSSIFWQILLAIFCTIRMSYLFIYLLTYSLSLILLIFTLCLQFPSYLMATILTIILMGIFYAEEFVILINSIFRLWLVLLHEAWQSINFWIGP